MKRLIAAAILSAFVAASYFTGFFIVNKTCENTNRLLNDCVENYDDGKDAKASSEKLQKYWEKKEKILSAFAHHSVIDEIEIAINNLTVYSNSKEKAIFKEHSNTVKTLLHQLMEDMKPSMHSIL